MDGSWTVVKKKLGALLENLEIRNLEIRNLEIRNLLHVFAT